MHSNPLLLELLVSGFFAIACFRAREGNPKDIAVRPRDLLRLTDRLERLRRTRWQWFAMVLVVVVVRLQSGLPLVVEVTAAMQFLIFLALPVQKKARAAAGKTNKIQTRSLASSIRSAKANWNAAEPVGKVAK